MSRPGLALSPALWLLSLACAQPPAPINRVVTAPAVTDTSAPDATQLAQRTLIVDGHIDLPYRLYRGRNERGQVSEDPTTRTSKGDFDAVRAKLGGLDAPFMSIYVPAKHQTEGGAKALADALIDLVEDLEERAPDRIEVARSTADVERIFAAGKLALPLGIENGAAIEGDLANLAHFHSRGVRYITLTHSKDNDISDSSYDDAHTHGGLSELGERVVREMNRLGIMVDVSHISDEAFWDVMRVTDVPVIASHSSCRHFTPGFERNMSDDMIRRLADEEGVIMINYGSTFISAEARRWSDDFHTARDAFAESRSLADEAPELKQFSEDYMRDNPLPRATVEVVADHIMHVVALVGIEHVGLGSDFDGLGDSLPEGLRDAAELPNLVAALLRRGLTEEQIALVGSGNVLRVWRAVEAAARGR